MPTFYRFFLPLLFLSVSSLAAGEPPTVLVWSPPPASTLAVGQQVDLMASISSGEKVSWRVSLDGKELSAKVNGNRVTVPGVAILAPGEHSVTFVAEIATPAQGGAKAIATAERRFQVVAWPAPEGRVKHVFLFVGDGMGLGHRTAARAFLHGFEGGKARGFLAMDRLPVGGYLVTSSLSGFVTDSAAGAHAFATGTKTADGMMGLFPDGTPEDADNPRVESLPCLLYRTRGMVSGLVSDADLTDATPAAFLSQVGDRNAEEEIAQQFLDNWERCGVKVLLGGGRKSFTKVKDLLPFFGAAGFAQVFDASELTAVTKSKPSKLLGLFAKNHMNSPFDLQRRGDPSVVSKNPDQPSLRAMTEAAVAVLKDSPNGFFLLVEGALVDKQAHKLDAERMLWDVYNLDQAVEVALAFAQLTNSDQDPTNDTLIIVTADHETGGIVLPGITDAEKRGSREQVATYDRLGFPEVQDTNADGYPDDPDPRKKLVIHFGAAPDHYDDFRSQPQPVPPATAGEDGKIHANPAKDGSTGVLYTGVTPTQVPEKGYAPDSGVHTGIDVPLTAFGPGAELLGGVHDNTEVFFAILKALAPTVGQPQSPGKAPQKTP